MNPLTVSALRFERQALSRPIDENGYGELFRQMSPVHTLYWTEPGSPPILQRRAAFDDLAYNDARRAARSILKGRYQNGSVGYVDARDLELYACAYIKPVAAHTMEELIILDKLHSEGSATVGGIKQSTGMLVKKITPVLHRLQQAFIVFEDQTHGEGYRDWYAFADLFPDVNLGRYGRTEAIKRIILRFLKLNVAACAEGARSFYGFSAKDVERAFDELRGENIIKQVILNNETRYILCEDTDALSKPPAGLGLAEPRGAFLLHRSDFWVKSEEYRLKGRYASEKADVLYYIVIDGAICGAALGRFKFGPHIIQDVQLDLPDDEAQSRREEILEAVYAVFDRDQSPVMRYLGEPLP